MSVGRHAPSLASIDAAKLHKISKLPLIMIDFFRGRQSEVVRSTSVYRGGVSRMMGQKFCSMSVSRGARVRSAAISTSSPPSERCMRVPAGKISA